MDPFDPWPCACPRLLALQLATTEYVPVRGMMWAEAALLPAVVEAGGSELASPSGRPACWPPPRPRELLPF